MNKRILVLIVFLVLLSSLTTFVHASQTFTVPPRSQQTVNLNLNQGDSVNGTFSVSGGTGTGVNFIVSDPNGKELLSYNYTSYRNFSFSASINGTYLLSFDNSFCSCYGGKTVTLDYSVNNETVQVSMQGGSYEGYPIAPIVLTFGVASAIVISTVLILMRRLRTNTNNATVSS
ncbi:MAG: emp24/gp25L/p24 family protein [Candidatus Bathyarchaeia archaeon]